MKSFDLLKKQFHFAGFSRWKTKKERTIGIAVRCGFLTLFASYFISSLWFLISTAKTFSEYSEGVFYILTASLLTVWYSTLWFKYDRIEELITELTTIIEKSE